MALTLGGIIGACGLFCGFLSWVLMCPGHPRDPKEDMEQMRYLSEQMRYLSEQMRKRAARKKAKKRISR